MVRSHETADTFGHQPDAATLDAHPENNDVSTCGGNRDFSFSGVIVRLRKPQEALTRGHNRELLFSLSP